MNAKQFLAWLKITQRPPLVMGILNVTQDSFSDGGLFLKLEQATLHALSMVTAGADIIDIGGESTRPGSQPVSAEEELDRIIPVIERIRSLSDVCISVDTYKPIVMREAIKAGASWINDIKALTTEGALETVARLQVPVCLMHMLGQPQSMQHNPQYQDVVFEVMSFFKERIEAALAANILRENLILDVGFGFGKSVAHNRDLMHHFRKFKQYELPLMLGVSRKSTLGMLLNQETPHRMVGGLALAVYAVMQGASIIRTHDVTETKQALSILQWCTDTE